MTELESLSLARPASAEQKLVRAIALSMFRAETREEKKSATERKSAWAAGKVEYVKRARKLYRALEREGVKVTLADHAG